MTEVTTNIYVALCACQKEFGKVVKGSINSHLKNKYAGLSDVVQAVLPVLSAHDIVLMHYIVPAGELSAMRTEMIHAPSGTKVWCDVPLIVDKQSMQGMKSATTYAKRVGLESLTAVAPEDDDGNAATAAAPQRQQRQQPKDPMPTEDQIEEAILRLHNSASLDGLKTAWSRLETLVAADRRVQAAKDEMKMRLTEAKKNADIGGDEIQY